VVLYAGAAAGFASLAKPVALFIARALLHLVPTLAYGKSSMIGLFPNLLQWDV
jgi:hypothetical protein